MHTLQGKGVLLEQLLASASEPRPSQNMISKEAALRRLLPDATQSTVMLGDIVEKCRQLAKFESGTYQQQRDVVNLRELAKSCMAIYSRERTAGLELELECPVDLVITSDRRLWQHALMNLIGNAVRFALHEDPAPARSRVTVRIARVGDGRLRVEVIDTGLVNASTSSGSAFGIRELAAQKLGSSGLGLHLSAQIVRMLHGKLDAVSPLGDGRGSSFREF